MLDFSYGKTPHNATEVISPRFSSFSLLKHVKPQIKKANFVNRNNTERILHCKEPMPKMRNKYCQKRNCAANFLIHVSVSDLYIPTIDLPILLHGYVDRSLGIYKLLRHIHECGNWD
jgi:hypothetical protein